jgi:hypothetical protein
VPGPERHPRFTDLEGLEAVVAQHRTTELQHEPRVLQVEEQVEAVGVGERGALLEQAHVGGQVLQGGAGLGIARRVAAGAAFVVEEEQARGEQAERRRGAPRPPSFSKCRWACRSALHPTPP